MTVSDIISRTLLSPNEISIGIVAAVIGAPLLFILTDPVLRKEEPMEAILKGKGISVGYQQNTIIQKDGCADSKGADHFHLSGPNGCGKSTLLKALSRIMPVENRSGDPGWAADRPTSRRPGGSENGHSSSKSPGSRRPDGGGACVLRPLSPTKRGFGKLKSEDRKAIRWALEMTRMEAFAQRNIDALSGRSAAKSLDRHGSGSGYAADSFR